MIDYDIIIKTVPERDEYLQELLSWLSDSIVIVIMDKHRSAMDTFLRGLAAAGSGAAIYIEDDALLTLNFERKADSVIQEYGEHPIQFFSRRKDDEEIGSRWIPGSSFSCNVCHYLPPGMSAKLLAYYKVWPRREEHSNGYDLMQADFMKERRMRYWNHVPSLAQHREGVSIINHKRSSRRYSYTFKEE